jgi:hypothetical protein
LPAGHVFEKQVGPATELVHLHLIVNHDGRRRVRAEDDAIRHFQKIGIEI